MQHDLPSKTWAEYGRTQLTVVALLPRLVVFIGLDYPRHLQHNIKYRDILAMDGIFRERMAMKGMDAPHRNSFYCR